MSLPILTDRLRNIVANGSTDLKATVKFATNEGMVFIDGNQTPVAVSNDDLEADCVLEITMDNALKLLDGDLNPMMAYMMGQLKIKGDMALAMKIGQAFGS